MDSAGVPSELSQQPPPPATGAVMHCGAGVEVGEMVEVGVAVPLLVRLLERETEVELEGV